MFLSRYSRPVESEQAFGAGSASVRAARRFVGATLARWGRDDTVWEAQLVVSELATNAVLHAGTPFTVRLTLSGPAVRLEVEDGVSRAPRERHFGPDATTGRGISLVSELSTSWGVSMRPGGKCVWCELTTGPAPDRTRFDGTEGSDGSDGSDEDVDVEAFLGPGDVDGADGSSATNVRAA